VKWALFEMGRIDRGIRLPLLELSEEHREELRTRLRKVGALR
jgi:4-hydroxy-tetrahydrodipicolinate synthase